ncbi:hypothetical protein D3C78_1014320 [compost metagenome]
MRREIGLEAHLRQHHVEAVAGGVRADAARRGQAGQREFHALDDLHVAFQTHVEQLFGLVEQRGGERNAGFAFHLQKNVLPGHAGETLAHFLDGDRITGLGQEAGFHLRRDDFGIDQNAVAVENNEVEAAHGRSLYRICWKKMMPGF